MLKDQHTLMAPTSSVPPSFSSSFSAAAPMHSERPCFRCLKYHLPLDLGELSEFLSPYCLRVCSPCLLLCPTNRCCRRRLRCSRLLLPHFALTPSTPFSAVIIFFESVEELLDNASPNIINCSSGSEFTNYSKKLSVTEV